MDHNYFKANQTAAVYIADGLDAPTQEAFELHLMSCLECVEDVEIWRAMKNHLPGALESTGQAPQPLARFSISGWRMAASLAAVGFIGVTGGYFLRSLQGAALDDTGTAVFSLRPLTRGAENCNFLPLSPDTDIVALRVPGVAPDQRVVAVDVEGRELARNQYAATLQADGTWVVRFQPSALEGQIIGLEARDADAPGVMLGCITGQVATAH